MLLDRLEAMYAKERSTNILDFWNRAFLTRAHPLLSGDDAINSMFPNTMDQPSDALLPSEGMAHASNPAASPQSNKKPLPTASESFQQQESRLSEEGQTHGAQPPGSLLSGHAMDTEMDARETDGGQLGLMMPNQQNPMIDFQLNSTLQRGPREGNPPHFDPSVYDSIINEEGENESFIDDNANLISVMVHGDDRHEAHEPMETLRNEEDNRMEDSRFLVRDGVWRDV